MSRTERPALTRSISHEIFENYYWLKSELIQFCREQGLSTIGSKIELATRISVFLATGIKNISSSQRKSKARDGLSLITRSTIVVDYRNDAATREFFVSQIGPRFHFNNYLRQFTNPAKIQFGMTYGDLVDGWLLAYIEKKQSQGKHEIPKQFEYNRFIRDFTANEKGRSLADAIKAWKLIKSQPGPNSYEHYRSMLPKKEK